MYIVFVPKGCSSTETEIFAIFGQPRLLYCIFFMTGYCFWGQKLKLSNAAMLVHLTIWRTGSKFLKGRKEMQ